MNYFSFHPNKYKQTFNEIKCRKNKKKEEEKRPIKEAKLIHIVLLFVLGICGIVSNPGPSQPIVSFLFWPILFWHLWYSLKHMLILAHSWLLFL
jgi:hypothetical protein